MSGHKINSKGIPPLTASRALIQHSLFLQQNIGLNMYFNGMLSSSCQIFCVVRVIRSSRKPSASL